MTPERRRRLWVELLAALTGILLFLYAAPVVSCPIVERKESQIPAKPQETGSRYKHGPITVVVTQHPDACGACGGSGRISIFQKWLGP